MTEADQKFRTWMACGALAIAAMLVYSNIYKSPFVFDSTGRILDNESIRQFWPPWMWLTYAQRPMAYGSFALNHAAHGYDLFGYHLFNVAVHIAAACVLLGVIRSTLALPGLRERYGATGDWIAFCIAMIWVVHPLQTECVTYTVQRMESMMGSFYLLTLACFIQSLDSPKRTVWLATSVVCCWLGVACKEIMVTAPICVLWFDRVFVAKSWRELWEQRRGYYCGLAASWGLLVVLITQLANYGTQAINVESVGPFQYALTQSGVILHYLRLAFVPVGQCLDYDWPVATTALQIVPATIVVLALLSTTVWMMRRSPAIGFVAGMFFLILGPTSSVAPLKDLAVEHRMYLPLACVWTLVVFVAFEFARPKTNGRKREQGSVKLAVAVFVLLAMGLGTMTYLRNKDFRDAIAIWTDVVEKAPHNPRAHYWLGKSYLESGDDDEAEECFRSALGADERFAPAQFELAMMLDDRGETKDAITYYESVIEILPEYAEAHYNLAILLEPDDPKEAIRHYRRTIDIQPKSAPVRYNLGNLLFVQERLKDAVKQFEKAVELDPTLVDARVNLGVALMRLDQLEKAEQQLLAALQLSPRHELARVNMRHLYHQAANAAFDSEDWQTSGDNFSRAIELFPQDAVAHFGLAKTYLKLSKPKLAKAHLQHAIRINPGYTDAEKLLSTIKN